MVAIAGWMNRRQQDVIALLREENRILREKLGHKRIRLNDAQRCRLALPNRVKHWSLTTLREKLVNIGAKVVSRSRYVTFQMAEVAIPRGLFRAILGRIRRLTPQPVVFR